MRRIVVLLYAVILLSASAAQAQSVATVINPSTAIVQWTHSGVLLQYFDYWVDNQPRPDLGTYQKFDATTYRHTLPADLTDGAHSIQIRACNLDLPVEKKCTDWLVVHFTVDRGTTPILSMPTNLTIITITGPPAERKSTPR